jgi:hypothetical protein
MVMGNISVLKSGLNNGKRKYNLFNPAILALITEVGLNFFRFLRSIGMSDEHNLVVLSSKDNYSCNEQELKNARIIINLKKLNLIKHLDLFLNSLVRILPPNTSFIGYFSDENSVSGNGFNPGNLLRILYRTVNLFATRTNHNMNRNEVKELLEKNGFKTLNMKEMNGLTYFISQNVRIPL